MRYPVNLIRRRKNTIVQQDEELGSAFLCADLGLTPEPRPDHASYIESWLRVLKNDKRVIFTAAAHADRAASFFHRLQPEAVTAANDDDEREAAA